MYLIFIFNRRKVRQPGIDIVQTTKSTLLQLYTYLSNQCQHYEPVIDLIHCRYNSYHNSYCFSDAIIIE